MLATLLFEVFVAFLREGIRATPLNRRVDGSLSCLAWPARCKWLSQEGMSVRKKYMQVIRAVVCAVLCMPLKIAI